MSKKTYVYCVILFTLIASLLVMPCAADSTSPTWSKTYGGSANDRAFSLIKTQDGGFALVGTTLSFSSNGLVNAWLVKTDSEGILQWNQTYSGLGASYPCAFVQTQDGGFALVGYTYSLDGISSLYPWFAKTDSTGNLMWNKTYSELGNLIGNLVQTADGGYAIVGYTTQSDDIIYAWLAKTDSDGNIQWKQNYGTTGDNELFAIIQTSDGSYTLAGYTTSAGAGQEDFWLIRTDASGNVQWNQTYGSPDYEMLGNFVQTLDGGYALFGYSTSTTNSDDFMMVKADGSGTLQWSKTYGDVNIDEAFCGIQTFDGGYVLTGVSATAEGLGNAWIIKTDTQGNMQWNQTYGNTSTENVLYSIVQADNGGYVAAGYTNSTTTAQDFWLLKIDENGAIPEFSGLFAVPLLAICTLIAAFIIRKKHQKIT